MAVDFDAFCTLFAQSEERFGEKAGTNWRGLEDFGDALFEHADAVADALV